MFVPASHPPSPDSTLPRRIDVGGVGGGEERVMTHNLNWKGVQTVLLQDIYLQQAGECTSVFELDVYLRTYNAVVLQSWIRHILVRSRGRLRFLLLV